MSVPVAPRLSPEMASRKLQVLAFIEQYFAVNGVGPSLTEIAASLKRDAAILQSDRVCAQRCVRKLAREGRIHYVSGMARSARPLTAEEEAVRRLRMAGYLVTNEQLSALPILDHPDWDGQEEEDQGSRAAG